MPLDLDWLVVTILGHVVGTEAVTLESGVELHLAVKVCKLIYLVASALLLLHIIVL